MTEETQSMHDVWIEEQTRGLKLSNMLNHRGWTDVLEPDLLNHKAILTRQLLDTNITKIEEFVLIRQSIHAVDSIFALINATLARGEKAAMNLKKEEGLEETTEGE